MPLELIDDGPFDLEITDDDVTVELECQGIQGLAGPAGYATPILNNTLLGNVSGITAAPIALNKATVKTLLGFVETSDLTNYPRLNTANTFTQNQTILGDLLADRIKLYDAANADYGLLYQNDNDLRWQPESSGSTYTLATQESLVNYVTLATTQTNISGAKTFNAPVTLNGASPTLIASVTSGTNSSKLTLLNPSRSWTMENQYVGGAVNGMFRFRNDTQGTDALVIHPTTLDAAFGGSLIAPSAVLTPTSDGQSTLRLNLANGTRSISLGSYPSLTSFSGLWAGSSTPSTTNYTLVGNGSSVVILNSPTGGELDLRIGGANRAVITDSTFTSYLDFLLPIAGTGIKFGGTTPSYAGLFASGTTVKARLADNSADAPFTASAVTASGASSITSTTRTALTLNSIASTTWDGAPTLDIVLPGSISTFWRPLKLGPCFYVDVAPSSAATLTINGPSGGNAISILGGNINSAGAITASGASQFNSTVDFGSSAQIQMDGAGARLRLPSSGALQWTASGAYYTAIKTTLSQQADGLLQIGTTTSNALGSLLLTNLTASGRIKVGPDVGTPSGMLWINRGFVLTTGDPIIRIMEGGGAQRFLVDGEGNVVCGSPSGGTAIGTLTCGNITAGAITASGLITGSSLTTSGNINSNGRFTLGGSAGVLTNNYPTLIINEDSVFTNIVVKGAPFGFSQGRFQQPSAQVLQTQVYDTTLAAWQETQRSQASSSGAKWSVFGATPVIQPVAIPDTTGAILLTIETEVNKIKQALRSLGLIAT